MRKSTVSMVFSLGCAAMFGGFAIAEALAGGTITAGVAAGLGLFMLGCWIALLIGYD